MFSIILCNATEVFSEQKFGHSETEKERELRVTEDISAAGYSRNVSEITGKSETT